MSKSEQELGGIPNSSEDVKQAHAAAIEDYIEGNVGILNEDGDVGRMYFQGTLEDWARFDITKRTAHDASISSGLALMATHRFRYRPYKDREVRKINFGFAKYNNETNNSRIINHTRWQKT